MPSSLPIIDGNNNINKNNEYEQDPRASSCKCHGCEKRRKDLINPNIYYHHSSSLKRSSEIAVAKQKVPKFSVILFYWHFLSIFLCLSILSQTVSGIEIMGKEERNNFMNNNNNNSENNGSHGPDIDDPGGGGGKGGSNLNNIVVIRDNPLLRHRRVIYQQQKSDRMCHVWNRHSPTDLCNKGRWARLRLLRVLSLWSTDCEKSNVQIGELFRLEWPKIKAESDLISHTEHLKLGIGGRDCLLAAPRSDECLACFNRMDTNILMMEKAYESFNHTLRRFDCTIAVDASSATRPFSPNGTCVDCKMWYRKWLLVQLLDIWHEAPCINWCYYAQLACPHIASSRQVDYAGQPSFFCRDLKVSKNQDDYGAGYCKCFHPCDLERTPPEPLEWYETNKNRISTIRQYDFFASNEHCWARKRICDAEKRTEENAIDGIRHIPSSSSTTSSSALSADENLLPASSSASTSSSTFFGFVHDAPGELFNQLGSWFFPSIISSSSSPPPTSSSSKNTGDLPSSSTSYSNFQKKSQKISANEPSSASSSSSFIIQTKKYSIFVKTNFIGFDDSFLSFIIPSNFFTFIFIILFNLLRIF